jgi:hypothetical protein
METSESGGKPDNLDLSYLKPLPEKKEVGSGVKKPEVLNSEESKQQPSGQDRDMYELYLPRRRRRGVALPNPLRVRPQFLPRNPSEGK